MGHNAPRPIGFGIVATLLHYCHCEHLISLVGWHDVMFLSLPLSLSLFPLIINTVWHHAPTGTPSLGGTGQSLQVDCQFGNLFPWATAYSRCCHHGHQVTQRRRRACRPDRLLPRGASTGRWYPRACHSVSHHSSHCCRSPRITMVAHG